MPSTEPDIDLRTAVAVVVYTVSNLTASAAVWAEKIPDEALRKDALKTLDECAEVMRGLARSFPPESLPIEFKGMTYH